MFGSISGAHFNPVVSLVFLIKKEIDFNIFILYIFAQVLGGLFGMLIAHFMFDTDLLQYSSQIRIGPSLWFSEFIAAFGLILTILFTIKENLRVLETEYENILLEYDYLSSAEKLLEFQSLYFEDQLIQKSIKNIKIYNISKNQKNIKELIIMKE